MYPKAISRHGLLGFATLIFGLMLVFTFVTGQDSARAIAGCDKYAALTGSNANLGTEGEPFLTVQYLIDELQEGEVGCLRTGTFAQEPSRLSVNKSNITLKSYPGERARITGRIDIPAVDESEEAITGVTLADLDIDGRTNEVEGSVTLQTEASDITFSGLDLTNNNAPGPGEEGGFICLNITESSVMEEPPLPTGNEIVNSRIHNCGKLPAENFDHGIYLGRAKETTIRRNLLYENSDRGIQFYPNADRGEVLENVVDGNGQGMTFSGDGSLTSDENTVKSNVFTNANVSWNVTSFWNGGSVGTKNVLKGNCLYASNPSWFYNGDSTPGDNSTSNGGIITEGTLGFTAESNLAIKPAAQSPEPPLYVDRLNQNFHLKSTGGAENDCLDKAGVTDKAAAENSRWQAPNSLSNSAESGEDFITPAADIGTDGTTAAAWVSLQGGGDRIQGIVREPGDQTGPNAWDYGTNGGANIATLSAAGQDADSPQVAVGGTGANRIAVATWTRWNGEHWLVQAAVWHSGSWGGATTLSATNKNAESPDVSVGSEGRAAIIWAYEGSSTYASVRAGGKESAFGEPTVVASGNTSEPHVVVGSSTIVAVWRAVKSGKDVIQTSYYSLMYFPTLWSSPKTMSSTSANSAQPSVAMLDGGGRAAASWRRYDGSNWIVEAVTWVPAFELFFPKEISAKGTDAFDPVVGIASGSSGDGDVVVSWRRFDSKGESFVAQAAVRRQAEALANPPRFPTTNTTLRRRPSRWAQTAARSSPGSAGIRESASGAPRPSRDLPAALGEACSASHPSLRNRRRSTLPSRSAQPEAP